MKKTTTLFLTVFMCFGAASAQTPAVSVKSLFDSGSMLPGSLIPFEVSGSVVSDGASLSAVVTESGGVDCRMLRDPYYPRIFLLKCAGEASVKMRFRVIASNKAYDLSYGPVTVKKAAGAGFAPVEEPVPTSPQTLLGKNLYSSYCMGCHTVPSVMKGRDSATIKLAIQGQLPRTAPMKTNEALQTLTDAQISAISTYLKKP